ncbi:MAG: hypothetical protein ACLTZB_04110 [Streptococcus salivarius]
MAAVEPSQFINYPYTHEIVLHGYDNGKHMFVIHLTPITMDGIHWITFMVFRVEMQWMLSLVHHSSLSLLNLSIKVFRRKLRL